MIDITLEKVDIIKERTGVSYAKAKEALEACGGDVVDALIYIEQTCECSKKGIYTTAEDLMAWLKEVVKKGNVTRIRIKKDERVIVDIPVNAGIAAGVVAIVWPPLIALGILTAVVTKLTIEITKNDGTVEVVNKIIKNSVEVAKDKFVDITSEMKEKINDVTSDVKSKIKQNDIINSDEPVYKYTVKFDNIDDTSEENKEF